MVADVEDNPESDDQTLWVGLARNFRELLDKRIHELGTAEWDDVAAFLGLAQDALGFHACALAFDRAVQRSRDRLWDDD